MHIKTTFKLSLTLDSDNFKKIFAHTYYQSECIDNNKYIDQTLAEKGVIVIYHDKQYKKKIQLIINPGVILNDDEPDKKDISKIVNKLATRIEGYFDSKYQINDFNLSEMILTTNIDVGSSENVSAYLKVLKRIGKVKGFTPSNEDLFDDNLSFCLDGISNGVDFQIYDFEKFLREQRSKAKHGRKKLKSLIEKSKGILRTEIRLMESKTIRSYTDEDDVVKQIADLFNKDQEIFLKTFMQIIPFGAFYKKAKTVEIIRKEVTDTALKRRMLNLLELIPKKKSLLLAQKALNYRRIDEVMEMFAGIELSPVTLSKRHNINSLKSLYFYL
jgi:energy-converting hydrogenase A subunit M